jgi:adenylate cyclase class IV
MKNVVIKPRVAGFTRIRKHLAALGARRYPKVLIQTDYYFSSPLGQLKLRMDATLAPNSCPTSGRRASDSP